MAPRRNTSINLGGPSPRSSQATPTQEEMDPSSVTSLYTPSDHTHEETEETREGTTGS